MYCFLFGRRTLFHLLDQFLIEDSCNVNFDEIESSEKGTSSKNHRVESVGRLSLF